MATCPVLYCDYSSAFFLRRITIKPIKTTASTVQTIRTIELSINFLLFLYLFRAIAPDPGRPPLR
jgi:hypothetical protein